ncbi:MAG: hypothetical protein GF392_01240 [Candidatus Omnitrophica bacterium]|nr:hypothetical protein [Candidatus Omnitrophota bacterium]
MKYRTVIEVVCDASDKEDALNIAGEYLRGDVDFGVDMKCRSASIMSHRLKRVTATAVIALVMFSAFLLKVSPIDGEEKIQSTSNIGFRNTYTINPALNTKHRSDFKKEWTAKKEQAIMEYIKE